MGMWEVQVHIAQSANKAPELSFRVERAGACLVDHITETPNR